MTRIECPFLQSLPLGIKGCEELGEVLSSFAEDLPQKSIRCPLKSKATACCTVSMDSFQQYLDKKSSPPSPDNTA